MANITEFFGCKVKGGSAISAVAPDPEELAAALLVMKPKPSPYPLIRVGGNGDGAYLLPDDLSGIKACFSPGVSNFKNFEDELTDKYKIDCHMVDKSSDLDKFRTPLKVGSQTFRKKWLDITGDEDSISLADWIEDLCPNGADDLLLQIDIEGAEYRNLLAASENTLKRFRIIVIELHGLRMMLNLDVFILVFGPLLKRIDSLFVCVHAHPNNCCGDFPVPGTDLNLPNVHELTFLRRDRMGAAAHADTYPPQIPHPLDIVRNVASKAPLFLNEGWIDGGRSPDAKIKILQDRLDFQEFKDKRNSIEAESSLSFMYKASQRIYEKYIAGNIGDQACHVADVAAGKAFKITSSFDGLPKTGIVAEGARFFFHTKLGTNESITIHLGRSYCIWNIRIKNRLDGCFDRANFLFYVLHQSPDRGADAAYPIQVNDDFISGRALQCDTPIPGVSSRYVTIFSPCYTALHFSAVQVFAEI